MDRATRKHALRNIIINAERIFIVSPSGTIPLAALPVRQVIWLATRAGALQGLHVLGLLRGSVVVTDPELQQRSRTPVIHAPGVH